MFLQTVFPFCHCISNVVCITVNGNINQSFYQRPTSFDAYFRIRSEMSCLTFNEGKIIVCPGLQYNRLMISRSLDLSFVCSPRPRSRVLAWLSELMKLICAETDHDQQKFGSVAQKNINS